ncbi:MAG: metalloregulator ArsR/SmtB family transcription factor [Pseudomonadales bacterium]|nr:metalloregulator ArsR/SmtB family transcription factor [Pseudomonadales bacterium]
MDDVFKALADPTRRQILDSLKNEDGQSLGELEAQFPDITRFAVMKHLKILEQAQLLSTRRDGRRKHHYLNAVPIQEISDRWISRFAAPWAQGLIDLRDGIEQGMGRKKA